MKNYSDYFKEICAWWGNVFILCVPLGRLAGGVSVAFRSLLPSSLAWLLDVVFDVLAGGRLGDTRLGLLMSHLGGCRGEVLITLCHHSRHNHGGPWWTAADVLLFILIFLRWLGSSGLRVLLHYPHTSCFYCRGMSSFGFHFLLRRRRHVCTDVESAAERIRERPTN